MPVKKDRREVSGSTKSKVPGATLVGDVRPDERIEVTVRLRAKPGAAGLAAPQLVPGQRISDRKYPTRQELAAATGADPADMAKIEAFASEHGLDVVQWSLPQRKVILGGPASSISQAFDVRLKRYRSPKGTYRGRTGPVTVPASIADIVEGVFGLDDRAAASPHFRALKGRAKAAAPRAAASSAKRGRARPRAGSLAYTPPQIASLYGFPTSVNGSGQCIAIIELGGGWRAGGPQRLLPGVWELPVPNVVSVSVDGGKNHPTTPNSADGEVMLDIEVAGAVAPGREIVVYFAPNTDQGFLDAIAKRRARRRQQAVGDLDQLGRRRGRRWTDQAMTAIDQAFQEAAAASGVTVCCASGDNGLGTTATADGRAHVDFPASSPYALACGGTQLEGSGSQSRARSCGTTARPGRRGRRRRERLLRSAHLSGRCRRSPFEESGRQTGPRRPRHLRRRQPPDGLPGARRRSGPGLRRHQRGCPPVGGLDGPTEPVAGRAGGVLQPRAVRAGRRGGGAPGHHERVQRRLCRRARAGTRAPAWAARRERSSWRRCRDPWRRHRHRRVLRHGAVPGRSPPGSRRRWRPRYRSDRMTSCS